MSNEIQKVGSGKQPVRVVRAEAVATPHRIIYFKGDVMYMGDNGTYEHLSSDMFARLAYSKLGGSLSASTIRDLEHYVRNSAPDKTHLDRYISFGSRVWDMRKVDWTTEVSSEDTVYASKVEPNTKAIDAVNKYLLEVANNNEDVRRDIIQSIAPLFTETKPSGVIWWQGSGSNSKSATMKLINKILDPYLASVTLKQLEDERDTPVLNGKLGNIVGESSEGVIEDSRTYKSIGTHEDFKVHKFHSQDQITINGNLHHIFSTNNMPIFGDKSHGAKRRTLIIKFQNRFKDDPTFEQKTFTPNFIAGFLHVVLEEAKALKERDYQYDWSEITTQTKEEYDKVVNTAETFVEWMIEHKIQFFDNFTNLRRAYDWWCDQNSYTALGKTHLRNAALGAGFVRSSRRDENGRNQQVFNRGTTDATLTYKYMDGLYALTEQAEIELNKVRLSDEW